MLPVSLFGAIAIIAREEQLLTVRVRHRWNLPIHHLAHHLQMTPEP